MPTSGGSPAAPERRVGSRLPASALADLRAAFTAELAERLPRLDAVAASRDPALIQEGLRDVHTLGSSAFVVGADDAARIARAAEAALLDGRVEEFAARVRDLTAALAGWVP